MQRRCSPTQRNANAIPDRALLESRSLGSDQVRETAQGNHRRNRQRFQKGVDMAGIALLNEIAEMNGGNGRYGIPGKLGRQLGSGCFSSVYHDPESEFHVIKCGGGDAWANYAAYCIDNPDNEHLPRINFLKVVSGRYVASIEKLRTVEDAKGPNKQQVAAWCSTLAWADKGHMAWDYMRDVSDHPLWRTLYDVNEKIGRTRDLSYNHNMMMRSDGTLVITDPIADDEYKGVNKYSLAQYNYDGYIIPERAHSNERYMVRKEMRYTSPVDRPEAKDRSLQATQSIAVCDARTGQVLGLLPQVSGALPTHDGASLPERYTAVQAAERRREDVALVAKLREGVPDDAWKNFVGGDLIWERRGVTCDGNFNKIAQWRNPIVPSVARVEPNAAEVRAAQRLHIRNLDPIKVMAAQGRVRR